MPRTFNDSGSKFMTSVTQRPSAHLTLRDSSSQGEAPGGAQIIALGQGLQEVCGSSISRLDVYDSCDVSCAEAINQNDKK